jgi:4Fe-4S ferredoxin
MEHSMPKTSAIDPDCKFEPGIMVPVIDPMRCEAKGPCIPICPYDVLALHVVPQSEKAVLPLLGRFKLFVHGGKQAFAIDPDACRGCGLCVQACPEKAIKLQKR